MAFVYKDNVRESTITTGVGTLSLGGASGNSLTFAAAIGIGNSCCYRVGADGAVEWEVGIGTVGSGTLTRATVLASSNAGALVNFSAGTKVVFCTFPAFAAAAYVGTAPPVPALDGHFWWDSTTGTLKIYYNDGNTSQWVDALSSIGGTAAGIELDYASTTASTAWSSGTLNTLLTGNPIVCDGLPLLLEFYSSQYAQSAAAASVFNFCIDGVPIVGGYAGRSDVSLGAPMYMAVRYTPSAGTHTFSFRNAVAGTHTFTISNGAAYQPAFMRVVKVVTASGTTSGTPSGTSFPTSPTPGQQFFRTDLGYECYYDGVRWLTKQEYPLTFEMTDTSKTMYLSANIAAGYYLAGVDLRQAGMWITDIVMCSVVATTNSGSIFWTVQFGSISAAGAFTNLGAAFNTSTDVVNLQSVHRVTVNQALAAGQMALTLTATKTSTPGGFYIFPCTVYYKLIIT